ncbi:hypothetical protein CJF35_22940 [Pseudomonas lundensis]|nr:hypothetical protein CJF35_22940 [Pseudomonas lundensis]
MQLAAAARQVDRSILSGKEIETPFYAYVWLSLEMLKQLAELNDQLHAALYHPGHKHLFKNNEPPADH